MNIGIDHGYSAVKTRHFSFPAGISAYSYEPYTLQNTLEYGGQYFVCGTGRQPILRNKTENRNYYLLTLAVIAKEIRQRGEKTECSVTIGAGLPLTLFGREKKAFREYLLYPEKPGDSMSPVCFKFEGVPYRITVQDVKLFPQGYSALAVHPELLRDEPSVLLMLLSYAGVCLEGLVIALSCVIFSAMASSPPAVDPNASAVTAVWTYVAELIFNFLVLVGSIKMSDRVVKELMGL